MDLRIWITGHVPPPLGDTFSAILTTDHPASSRGLPVVLIHRRGQPLLPDDLDAWATLILPESATTAELQAAQHAGYRAVREPWPPARDL